MKRTLATAFAFALCLSALSLAHAASAPRELDRAFAPEPAPAPALSVAGPGIGGTHWRFTGRMQNLFLWRNDSDFDRTPPYYDEHGQSVGLVGTFLAPRFDLMPTERLRIVSEVELGLNIWSMQDPEVYGTGAPGFFRLAMRQLYMEGTFFDRALSFRAGYERLFDLSGLFMGHWLGAATVATAHSWGYLALTVGQLPDQTYEGVAFDATNFSADTVVYGLRGDFPLGALLVSASVWGLHDGQVVGQTLDLMTATLRLAGRFGGDTRHVAFGIDAGLQVGRTTGRAGGRDERTLAWSAQGNLDAALPLGAGGGVRLLLFANAMALSGDDAHDGNDWNGAWFYSGRSRSRTLLLTEDFLRDRGGSLDRLMGERRQGKTGKFYVLRSGLFVGDVSVGLDIHRIFRPVLTVGAAMALAPENALGRRFVGIEADLHLEVLYADLLSVNLVQSVLVPGGAGAAFVNRTGDRGATDPVYQVALVTTLSF